MMNYRHLQTTAMAHRLWNDVERPGYSQNESWDDAYLHQVRKAFPARVEVLNTTAEQGKAPSSLDDYLQNHPSSITGTGFTLSIPSHSLPLPAAMSSNNDNDNEQMNGEGESCDQSVVSDLTQMTYRAELMKQVSRERAMTLLTCILA